MISLAPASMIVDFMYNWNYFNDKIVHHPLTDCNNLFNAFHEARKGSHWKNQVQKFRWNKLSELKKLQDELNNFKDSKPHAYKTSSISEFFVQERGKVRPITGLQIRDRVVRHCLNDIFLIPLITPHLIYDNGASLKGKGISFSRNRIVTHLEKFFKENHTNKGYILLMDYSKFYDNIRHDYAFNMISQYVHDDFVLKLTQSIYAEYKIDVSYLKDESEISKYLDTKLDVVKYRKEHHPKLGKLFLNKSMSVGDQTSQITAIAFPTQIDYLIKHKLQRKFYGRYMDDSYIISKNKESLKQDLEMIYKEATSMGIFINLNKTHISRIDQSFKFLQFKYYLTDKGHIVIRINPKTIVRMRRKLKKLANKNRSLVKIEQLFKAWIGNYYKYMSKKQKKNIIKLYRKLYGGGLDLWLYQKHIY